MTNMTSSMMLIKGIKAIRMALITICKPADGKIWLNLGTDKKS